MQKAMTLTYETGGNLYLNVTNQCPCACEFCIRKNDDGAYGSDPLWLEHEPTMQEMRDAIAERDLTKYPEIVFCGYGEPTMRLDFICELSAYIRKICPTAVLRLNTNGLTELYYSKANGMAAETAAWAFDKISISLNAGDSTVYNRVTHPKGMPEEAYDTMLSFAKICKAEGAEVTFTVVDVITPEEIAAAQAKADELGIPLHVRAYIS